MMRYWLEGRNVSAEQSIAKAKLLLHSSTALKHPRPWGSSSSISPGDSELQVEVPRRGSPGAGTPQERVVRNRGPIEGAPVGSRQRQSPVTTALVALRRARKAETEEGRVVEVENCPGPKPEPEPEPGAEGEYAESQKKSRAQRKE